MSFYEPVGLCVRLFFEKTGKMVDFSVKIGRLGVLGLNTLLTCFRHAYGLA
jgi:hypothetical protein